VRGNTQCGSWKISGPALLTLHLIALDHIEHEAHLSAPKAMAVLERLDAVIGKVWAAAER